MDSLMKNATKLKLLKKDLAKSFTKASTEKWGPHYSIYNSPLEF